MRDAKFLWSFLPCQDALGPRRSSDPSPGDLAVMIRVSHWRQLAGLAAAASGSGRSIARTVLKRTELRSHSSRSPIRWVEVGLPTHRLLWRSQLHRPEAAELIAQILQWLWKLLALISRIRDRTARRVHELTLRNSSNDVKFQAA